MEFENTFTISTMNLLESYCFNFSDFSSDNEDLVVGASKPRTTVNGTAHTYTESLVRSGLGLNRAQVIRRSK